MTSSYRICKTRLNAANEPAAEPEQPPAEAEVAPGVDLESEQLFSDEAQSPEGAVAEDEPQPATPAAELGRSLPKKNRRSSRRSSIG